MSFLTRFIGKDTLSHQQNKSLGALGTMALWLGANVVVTTILTGMLLVPDLSFSTAVGSILFGSLIGAIPLLLVGLMGQRTGLTSMVLTRRPMGQRQQADLPHQHGSADRLELDPGTAGWHESGLCHQ